jgi:hypothetical protein
MAAGKKNGCWQRQVLSAAVVMPLVASMGLVGVCAGSGQLTSTILTNLVGFSQPRLVYLKPGLRIQKKAPKGWTHLVMKSLPRLVTGDRGSLPSGSAKTASLFHSVLVANVKPVDMNEKDFELTQVGLGMCVPNPQDEAEDIVVTADHLDALGLDHLTMVQKMVLDAAEVEMAEGRIIARTATFALFRSPVTMVDTGGKHSKFNLHYAFCVDRPTGKLHVGVWPMRPTAEPQQGPTTMVKLDADSVFPVDLDELERLLLETLSSAVEPNVAGQGSTLPSTDRAIRRTAIPPPYRKPQ